MKSSANPGKGQRSISSFFFTPKGGTASKSGQPKQRVLGEKHGAQEPPLHVSGKRQRLTPQAPQPQEHLLHPRGASSPSTSSLHASSAAVETPAAAHGHSKHAPASLIQSENTATTYTQQTQVPPRVEHRHQQFQQKLVVGAGNKAEGRAKGLAAVTKPKYTPLEMQIVELKEKHPNVLLIVEVHF